MKTLEFEWLILEFFDKLETDFMNLINWFITELFGSLLLVVILMMFYWTIDKEKGKRIAFSFATTMCFNNLIKGLVNRPRPFAERPNLRKLNVAKDGATGSSFPSGHTMNSTSLYSGIFYTLKNKKSLSIKIILVIIMVLVGITRIYLGVHFPTDVIAGFILGLIITISLMYIQERFFKYNKIVYLVTLIFFLPCIFFNRFGRDFIKAYGILVGFVIGNLLEEKFINFDTNVNIKNKILRIVVGILIVGITYLTYSFVPDAIHNNLVFTYLMHVLIMFNGIFTTPFVFKKIIK